MGEEGCVAAVKKGMLLRQRRACYCGENKARGCGEEMHVADVKESMLLL